MKLTTSQQNSIGDAIASAGIKYQDLYEELFDHYASAIEDRTQAGQTFGAALGAIHQEFMSYKRPSKTWDYYSVWETEPQYGLERLQFEYQQNLDQELTTRQWQIVKSYFRWPAIVGMILAAALSYQLADLLPPTWVGIILTVGISFPYLVMLPHVWREGLRFARKERKFRYSLKGAVIFSRTSWLVYALNVSNVSNTMTGEPIWQMQMQGFSTPIIAAFLFSYAVSSVSFWQLYQEKFKFTLAQ